MNKFKQKWLSGPVIFILVILLGLSTFITWAVYFRIDEMARARGQVIAVARTQVIQAAQEGVLAQLYVEEGQEVKRGDLLVRLEQDRAQASVEDSRNKVAALKASLSRLRAEVYNSSIEFPAEMAGFDVFKENQTRLYTVRRRALEEGVGALQANRALVMAELSITEPLLQAGDVGQVEVIRLRRQLAELDGQIVNLRNKFFQDAQAEMTRAEEELAAQEQMLRERSVVLEQTQLYAPMDGIVRKIAITTPGAALRPGEVVLEMLPRGSELVVEAKYAPTDVASLQIGLPAQVKLDAYDDSVFGSLKGEVLYISPDALSEPDQRGGESFYYRVHIRLEEPPKEAGPRKEPVIVMPGMTATAEVRTRDRSVFSYLTKPITKTFSQAMSER